MDERALLDLYDRELRIEIEMPGVKKEVFPDLVRFTRPAPGMNFVHYSRLTEEGMDEAIAAQVDHFSQFDQPFTWHVFRHDSPASLTSRLEARGFEKDDDPDAVLVLDLHGGIPSMAVPDGVKICRLTVPDQLEDVRKVEAGVLGGDFGWLVERLSAHMAVPDYLSVYAAYAGNLPVCAGWIYFHPHSQFAGLFGGATLEEQRGRGIYSALLSRRIQEAVQRGRRFITTGASPMSRPILEKAGFHLVSFAYDFILKGNPQQQARPGTG